eukprot:TRINITY_DN2161_c0_g2_i1.p1 TRINITY_DN2161_c0_g2~~TRINITY_DN2161_c0_g2_i1.p1  ORF type:complete len:525 (-),score=71.58 TRINITY_DN2161_c0_g2_i1:75-1649(-)
MRKKVDAKTLFDSLAKIIGIRKWEDWYNVSHSTIQKHVGRYVIESFEGGSHISALIAVYPEHPWKPWKFVKVSNGFWQNADNQRKFLDDLAIELKLKDWHDWYKIGEKSVIEHGGGALLNNHKGSMHRMLATAYPEIPWKFGKPSKGEQKDSGYWADKKNQFQFLEDLAKQVGIKHWEDWYNVKQRDFVENGGGSLLNHFQNQHLKAITSILNQFPWHRWKTEQVSVKFWDAPENQRAFFEQLFRQLSLKDWKDWYEVKSYVVSENGGKDLLLHYHGNSLARALLAVFPEHSWKIQRLDVPNGFWDESANLQALMEWLSTKLNIETLSDWNGITGSQLESYGCQSLLRKYGSIPGLLRAAYPQHDWDESGFTYNWYRGSKSKTQVLLFKTLSALFPKLDVQINWIVEKQGGEGTLEVDIAIPDLALVFEYQGRQHYLETRVFSNNSLQRERDEKKRESLKKKGLTLVEVPFWWDRQHESLLASVEALRPDVSKLAAEPFVSKVRHATPKLPPDYVTRQHKLDET